MGLSVVIPSKTDSNLIPCMEAVRRHEPSARIIVVDDGLKLDWLPRPDLMPAIGVRGEKPFIYARNCNIGIALAERDDVVLLNDDAILQTPCGFSQLQRVAEQQPAYGLVSASVNIAGNLEQLPSGSGLRAATRAVAFVCVLLPRRVIDVVGLLDPRFTAYGYEDNDYCRRVREAGFALGIDDRCFVDHGSLRSTFRGDPHAPGDISAGAAIYRQKWGDLE